MHQSITHSPNQCHSHSITQSHSLTHSLTHSSKFADCSSPSLPLTLTHSVSCGRWVVDCGHFTLAVRWSVASILPLFLRSFVPSFLCCSFVPSATVSDFVRLFGSLDGWIAVRMMDVCMAARCGFEWLRMASLHLFLPSFLPSFASSRLRSFVGLLLLRCWFVTTQSSVLGLFVASWWM